MNQTVSATGDPEPRNIPGFRTQSEQTTPSATRSPSGTRVNNIEDEERFGLEIASAALGKPERAGEVPFYAGTENDILRCGRTNTDLLFN